MPAAERSQLVLCRRLVRQARPYWLHCGLTLFVGLLATPIALLTPLPITLAVDTVISGRPLPRFLGAAVPSFLTTSPQELLTLAVVLLVLITVLQQVQTAALGLLYLYTSEKLLQDFRSRMFRHVQRLSLAYHDSKGATDSAYRIQYDAYCIDAVMLTGLIGSATAAATLVGMIAVIVRLDWQLSIVALGVAPPLFLLSQVFREPLRRRWHEIKELDSRSLSVVQEVLGNMRVVKAFGREGAEHDRYLSHSVKRISEQVRVTGVQGAFDILVGLTIASGTALVLWIGVRHVQAGVLTLGGLLLVLAYLGQLYAPLVTLSKTVTEMQSAMVSAERVFALFDEAPEVVERPNLRRLGRSSGLIAFRDVSFSYDRSQSFLRGVSFDVPAGARVGISGQTGAGKTTLLSLLMRFCDPSQGAILLDGVDLREYPLADLRNQFALVLQDPMLFSATIAENIAYGRPSAPYDEIVRAATLANAHDFISRLPDGYQTMVGEQGMQISGGERQRVSLARAFLKDAPILLLDEPTSALDVITEAGIMEAMERLMEGRTTLMIAHRLSTLDRCTVRLHVQDGTVQSRTPTDLSRWHAESMAVSE